MKIHWNGFLKQAVENYPKESCAFLFSKNPYSSEEEWFAFSVKNIAENQEEQWRPDKKEMLEVKRKAIKLGLIKIGNIHTHPYTNGKDVEEIKLPSDEDLRFARKFNDIVRGILIVDKNLVLGYYFHDKFGNEIPIVLEEIERMR